MATRARPSVLQGSVTPESSSITNQSTEKLNGRVSTVNNVHGSDFPVRLNLEPCDLALLLLEREIAHLYKVATEKARKPGAAERDQWAWDRRYWSQRSVATNSMMARVRPSPGSAGSDSVRQVFAYWQQVMAKPEAKLDAKRRAAIAARLTDGYTPTELQRAVDGCRASAWHQGHNDRGRAFDDIALICRDAAHVEKRLAGTVVALPQTAETTARQQLCALRELIFEMVPATAPSAAERVQTRRDRIAHRKHTAARAVERLQAPRGAS